LSGEFAVSSKEGDVPAQSSVIKSIAVPTFDQTDKYT